MKMRLILDAWSSDKPYLVRTSDPRHVKEVGSHPLDDKVYKHKLNLGDKCGLTQAGVHLNIIPPGNISTVPHWHSHEDEWFYIIKAGEGARIVIHEKDEIREEEVRTGDFFGFPAATKISHMFKTGSDELVYLVGGSRKEAEVVHYPLLQMRAVIDRTGPTFWGVKEEDIMVPKQPFSRDPK